MTLPCAMLASLIAFGATSGKPTVEETAATLAALKDAGFSGYMIYPRSGLEYGYMEEDWLDYVEGVVSAAERIGIEIWLYDEFNWPSGSCKGRVPAENPEWAYSEYEVSERTDGSFAWEIARDLSFGANNYSLAAMDRFRELTHAKYERRLKRFFGKTVAGIMTDEPAHYSNGRRREVAARRKASGCFIDHFRWYAECESDYAKATGGRDFRRDAEAFYRGDGDGRVWEIYTENLGRRFISAHFEPTRRWCERNGILCTGHMIAEQNPVASAENNGLPADVLASLAVPGADEIYSHADAKLEWLTFHLLQRATLKNGRGGLTELFAMGPCDMTWEHMLKMIRLSAMHGADRHLVSLCQLNALGFTDPSKWWAMFVSPDQPWFREFRAFAAEEKRLSEYAVKKPRFDVAVRYPQRRFGAWARMARAGRKADAPDLGALLRDLELAGFATLLLDETEETDLPVVSSLDEAKRVARPGGRAGTVTRTYSDGSSLALDEPEPSAAAAHSVPFSPDWLVSGDRPVLSRIRFSREGTAELSLARAETVRFAVRTTNVSRAEISVDGLAAECPRPGSGDLPPAYRGLYGETMEMNLAAGRHVLRLTRGRDDCFYLPAAWAIRKFDPALAGEFAGRLSYSAQVDVPARAEALRLDTGGAPARAFIDGTDLGLRGWTPFEWRIPETAKGRRAELRVEICTSIRPVFGREDVAGAYPAKKVERNFPAARLHGACWTEKKAD